jgi:predicted ATP-binding protein involved in virulence
MRIDKITVSNYRCFEKISLDFDPQLTVIVADNGGGKTALLDAVAFGFGLFATSLSTTQGGLFGHTDVQRLKVRETVTNEMESQYPLTIEIIGVLDGQTESWKRELRTAKGNPTNKDAKILSNFAKKLQTAVTVQQKDSPQSLPLIVHYGTGRLWKEKSLINRKKAESSRLSGYLDCLDPISSYKWFVEWLRSTTQGDIQHRQKNSEVPSEYAHLLEAIRQPIDECLKPVGWEYIEYDLASRETTVTNREKGILPVSLLSDGIRNMIGLVADIAYRIIRLNPHLGQNAAKETSGIVLIDEVDMHLHPKWQQLILPNLTNAFPKLQFIVTTHSPLVLSTVRPASIRDIDWNDGRPSVNIPRFSYGAESNQLLENIQKVNVRPNLDITQDLKRYFELLESDNWDSSEALELRQRLDEWGHGNEPALVRADTMIRLKKYNRKLSEK